MKLVHPPIYLSIYLSDTQRCFCCRSFSSSQKAFSRCLFSSVVMMMMMVMILDGLIDWLCDYKTNGYVCLFVCKIGGCRLMEAKHATYWQELLMDQWECMIHNKPLPSTPSLTLPSMRPCSLWTSRCRKDTCTLCLLFNGILWILVSLSLAHLTTTSICGTQIHCRYPANPPPPPRPSLSFCFPKKKH